MGLVPSALKSIHQSCHPVASKTLHRDAVFTTLACCSLLSDIVSDTVYVYICAYSGLSRGWCGMDNKCGT